MNTDFGNRLKKARKNKGYTQQRLCELINEYYLSGTNTSITRNAITMYETGARKPNYEILVALSHALDIDINYLRGATNNKHSNIVEYAYKSLEASIHALLEQDNHELNNVLFSLLTNLRDTFNSEQCSIDTLITLNNTIYEQNKKTKEQEIKANHKTGDKPSST